jgi:hypothetical protein
LGQIIVDLTKIEMINLYLCSTNTVKNMKNYLPMKNLLSLFCFKSLAILFLFCLTIPSQAQVVVLTNIWNIAPGSRPYINGAGTTGTERGIAISPVDGSVFIVSRSANVGGLAVYVLDGETGAEIDAGGQPLKLDVTGISGGLNALNVIGVAEDGVIYACNLATSTGTFKIYRWTDVNSAPTVAFGPANPGATFFRYGDTMDVRGSGTATEIIVSGSGSAVFGVFTTADGLNFTSTQYTIPTGAAAGDVGKGIAFGVGNTIYGKKDANTLAKHLSYDGAGTASFITNITVDTALGPIAVDNVNGLLAGVAVGTATTNTSVHRLKIYNITNLAAPILKADYPFPSPSTNDSVVGAVDIGSNKIVALDPNNGVVAASITISLAPIAPTITTQPTNQAAQKGGYVTFSVVAEGTAPLFYQWYYNNTTLIPNATNQSVLLTNLTLSSAGNYRCVVTNEAGSVTSSNGVLTMIDSAASDFASPVWSLGSGSRPYLTSGTSQRGLAYNPATDHLLVATRVPNLGVYVLNAATGADVNTMDMTGVSGGFFALNVIAADEDGVVYGANLMLESGGSLGSFKLYRWQNDSPTTQATEAYGPADPWPADAGGRSRFGDTINIRGKGTNTQIILSANTESRVIIFNTTDGLTFTPTAITITNSPNIEQFRLGIAFGLGNTFWGKGLKDVANSRNADAPLHNVAFNLATGTGEIVHTYQAGKNTISAIGVEIGNDILAGLAFETPDNIKVYDISDLNNEPPLQDQDFFATDNPNQFLTGAFDSGGGRLYAMDTGNGILTLRISNTFPAIVTQPVGQTNAVGTRAIFAVRSTGYPRKSQWQHNGVNIPNATTSSLTIENVQTTNAGNYQLVITNNLGSVTSSVVSLRVSAGIITNPTDQVVNAGETINLAAVGDGEAPLSYQWRLNGTNVPGATTANLSIPNAQVTNAGNYTMVVSNPFGSSTSQPALVVVVIPSTPGTGTGLTGEYRQDRTNTFDGPAHFTQVDPVIDFDFGAGFPAGELEFPPDYFTIRWSGQVEPLYSQTYTFYANTDDGVRLNVNGQQLIDQFVVGQVVNASATIALTANQKYNIIMEYAENTGVASAHLSWSSASQVKQIIPQIQLYPTLGTVAPTIGASVSGTNLVLTWSGAFTLQSATNVAGPYGPVPGATSPHTNSLTSDPQRFFRLFSN